MVESKKDNQLTRNQGLVLAALEKANAPAGAYELLEGLRSEGLRAPPQIYRALDRLVELGLAHRLDSLNAFVSCKHPDCAGNTTVAFTICDNCGEVGEVSDGDLSRQIRSLAEKTGLGLTKSTVEIHGICSNCENA